MWSIRRTAGGENSEHHDHAQQSTGCQLRPRVKVAVGHVARDHPVEPGRTALIQVALRQVGDGARHQLLPAWVNPADDSLRQATSAARVPLQQCRTGKEGDRVGDSNEKRQHRTNVMYRPSGNKVAVVCADHQPVTDRRLVHQRPCCSTEKPPGNAYSASRRLHQGPSIQYPPHSPISPFRPRKAARQRPLRRCISVSVKNASRIPVRTARTR
jgi:hypothetical protein